MMTKKEVMTKVCQALRASLQVPTTTEIRPESNLRDDLGIDSISSMSFLIELEDQIEGLVVDADTLEARHFNNVATICEYVLQQLRLQVQREREQTPASAEGLRHQQRSL